MRRRPCSKCNRNRQEKFFVSPKGRVCSTCRNRRTKHASRDVRLQENYNITQADYDRLFTSQGGVCAICGGKRPGNLDVDHDHFVEKYLIGAGVSIPEAKRASVRGLLCRRCNRRLLPAATDSVQTLRYAIDYIQYPPAPAVLGRSEGV